MLLQSVSNLLSIVWFSAVIGPITESFKIFLGKTMPQQVQFLVELYGYQSHPNFFGLNTTIVARSLQKILWKVFATVTHKWNIKQIYHCTNIFIQAKNNLTRTKIILLVPKNQPIDWLGILDMTTGSSRSY